MAIKAEFDVQTDQIEFRTKTNGDEVRIRNVHLGQQQAQNLAYLVNDGATLEVRVKIKGE